VLANAAGMIAKYLATSLAMLNLRPGVHRHRHVGLIMMVLMPMRRSWAKRSRMPP
jgi:hypothetical protein